MKYLKYLTALMLFGSNGIIASFISLSSYEIVLMRTFFGSLLLLAIFFLSKQRIDLKGDKKGALFILASGAAMGLSWIFLYEAYKEIGVTMATLAYYTGPVIVMAASPVLFKEKLTLSKVIGFIAVLIGIAFANGQALYSGSGAWGFFCGGASAFTYAAMVICNKKAEGITGLANAAMQLFISFLSVAAFVIVKEGLAIHILKTDWIPILVLGLINTGVGCYFYFSSIGGLSVQTVAISGYIEPLSAIAFAAVFLKEKMGALQFIGAALIIGGAIFAEAFKGKAQKG